MSAAPERSIGAVVRDISGNLERIVRGELRFAIAELHVRMQEAGSAAMLLAAGALCAMLAAAFLLLGVMFALAIVMPLWLAALVVGTVVAAGAGALFIAGRARFAPAIESPSTNIVTKPEPVE